jgi:hypothetical protein
MPFTVDAMAGDTVARVERPAMRGIAGELVCVGVFAASVPASCGGGQQWSPGIREPGKDRPDVVSRTSRRTTLRR